MTYAWSNLEVSILDFPGSEESSDPYRLTQSTVEAALEISRTPYFKMNKNVWVHIYPGSHHNFEQWTVRSWTALKLLLPPDGAPRMPPPEKTSDKKKCDTSGAHANYQNSFILIITVLMLNHLQF